VLKLEHVSDIDGGGTWAIAQFAPP
jgi:hypothetical protein